MSSVRQKSVVLLSSGLDSTVNLFEAKKQTDIVLAITFDYGQRAAVREVEQARRLADFAGVRHQVVSLPWFREFTKTSLVNHASAVPVRDDVSIDDLQVSGKTAKAVWVPNRNGILLNVAAGFAEGLGADLVIPGFNLEEAQTFPDNSEGFLQALTTSLHFSTANHVKAKCFTTALDKTAIVKLGVELGVPFELIWPCYFAEAEPCGQCESCQRFQRALKATGVVLKRAEKK